MKKFICTTTINSPTDALKRYSEMKDWNLIVAGDLTTPHSEYMNMDLIYLTPKIQESKYTDLSNIIGWNTIERRNFAILEAYERGADLIALVDDDNIPLMNWGKDILISKEQEFITYYTSLVFDPLKVTNYSELWHRGFPIELLDQRNYTKSHTRVLPDIQANFWNGQPDIDAVCRINNRDLDCKFNDRLFPFTTDGICPFDSQNTILSRRVIKDGYFLFPKIGRMSDIWASYYITAKGYKVVYDKATVYQDRNEHNLVKDLQDEMLGYRYSLNLIESLQYSLDNIYNFIPYESSLAFEIYMNIIESIK